MPSTLILASNAPGSNASNVSASGDSFDIEFASPMAFPAGSKPKLCIAEAGVWFSFVNLSGTLGNDKLYYTDDAANAQKYAITLPAGLYSIDAINQAMSVGFVANGHPETVFQFNGDTATGRVYLVKEASTTAFQFNFGVNSPAAELGFAANSRYPSGATTTAAFTTLSPQQAALDKITSVILHCSLAAGASYIGGSVGAGLASFTPGDASPGQLINYKPYFQQWVDIPRLAGSSVSRMTFFLTDQSGQRGTINTNLQPFSVSLLLEW